MAKLNYRLDKTLPTPLYLQLYQQIKQAIYAKTLTFGERLASKRQLSDYLQISQNTVENAYQQLLAEGYITAKPRLGFYVCFETELDFPLADRVQAVEKMPKMATEKVRFDFNPNRIDTTHFPFEKWKKCGRDLYRLSQQHLLQLGDGQGDLALRQEIARYLNQSRGVHCAAEQIIIGSGIENCLQPLILLFNQLHHGQPFCYAMEHYGYQAVEKLLKLNGKDVVKLPLDHDSYRLDPQFLADHRVNVAYLTPSHLYPFGQVMSIAERQQLLEWASLADNRYIIEDDYDSEFRYKGKPIPALQSLDQQGKVIYLGSFSKLLSPALRISFLVLPPTLLAHYRQHCGFYNAGVSRFEQQRLTAFMAQGEFAKHIQRMRKIYRRKMELLCRLLAPHRQKIRYYGEHSGFYLLIELRRRKQAENFARQALARQIKIYPINYQQQTLFILGFGALSEQEIETAVGELVGLI